MRRTRFNEYIPEAPEYLMNPFLVNDTEHNRPVLGWSWLRRRLLLLLLSRRRTCG
jgi:hypothetical protein